MLNAVFSAGTQSSYDGCLEGLSSYIQHLVAAVGPSFLFSPRAE
jgi:hypothetical protein